MLGVHGTCLDGADAKELGVRCTRVLVKQIAVLRVDVAVMIIVGMTEVFSTKSAFWDLAANILWLAENLPKFRRGICIARRPACTANNGEWIFGYGLGRHDASN